MVAPGGRVIKVKGLKQSRFIYVHGSAANPAQTQSVMPMMKKCNFRPKSVIFPGPYFKCYCNITLLEIDAVPLVVNKGNHSTSYISVFPLFTTLDTAVLG